MNENYIENVKVMIDNVVKQYHDTGKLPTDINILRLSINWTHRDWKQPINVEGIAFQRGIEAGMLLMRNIIENNKELYEKLNKTS